MCFSHQSFLKSASTSASVVRDCALNVLSLSASLSASLAEGVLDFACLPIVFTLMVAVYLLGIGTSHDKNGVVPGQADEITTGRYPLQRKFLLEMHLC